MTDPSSNDRPPSPLLSIERLRVYPRMIVVLFFLGWLGAIFLGGRRVDVSGAVIGADFIAFYTGGRFLIEGRLDDLYDLSAQERFQRELLAPEVARGFTPFLNPPFTTLLYAPFSWSAYLVGLFLWWAAGLLLLWVTVLVLKRELFSLHPSGERRLFFLCFLFFPTLAWLSHGQITSLSLLLYTLFFVGLRRGRDLWAGVVLGLLLYKPQLMLAPLLLLLMRLRLRALLGVLLGAGLWVALGLLLDPPSMGEYLTLGPKLLTLLRSSSYRTWGLQSFYGAAILLLDGLWPAGVYLLSMLLTLSGLAFLAWRWRLTPWRPTTPSWDLLFASTLALGLLISPHLYFYDLMLLLLPLGILWSHYPQGSEGRPLDGGRLLRWSALLYVASFLGSYLTLGQLELCQALGLPAIALQGATVVVVGWSLVVARASSASPGW